MCGLKIIAITAPDEIRNEAERISDILYAGEADFMHIRKPSWDISRIRKLILEIPAGLRTRLKIHSHFRLADELGLGGVHLNSRNPIAPAGAGSVSISFHSIEQLADSNHYDYVTLSPIFDSISKHGYRKAFDIDKLRPEIKGRNVVALGGVTPDRFPQLQEAGFYGAAMLGYYWDELK